MLCFLSLILAHETDGETLQKPKVPDKQQIVVPNYQETSEEIKRQCYNQLPENLRYLQGCLTQNGCGATDLTLSPPQEALVIQALQGKKVLDIGPGYGHAMLTALASGAIDCTVIDLAEKHIEYIRNHCHLIGINPSYLATHVGHFPNDSRIFADNSFDAVLASRVIHFLNPYGSKKENSELDRFFSEVYRILKPGGEFYVLTISPNENWKLKSRYMLRKFFRAEYPGLQSDQFSRAIDWCIPSGMLETAWYQNYLEYKKRLPDQLLFLLPDELSAIARRHEFSVSRSGEVGIPQKITQEIHNPIPAQKQTDPNTTKIVVAKAIKEVTPYYTFGTFIKPTEPQRRAYSTSSRSRSYSMGYDNIPVISRELPSSFLNVEIPKKISPSPNFSDIKEELSRLKRSRKTSEVLESPVNFPNIKKPSAAYVKKPNLPSQYLSCKELPLKLLRAFCRTR